jgi:hypothetical protein
MSQGRVCLRFLEYIKSVTLFWTLGLQEGAAGAVTHELERPETGLEHLLKLPRKLRYTPQGEGGHARCEKGEFLLYWDGG